MIGRFILIWGGLLIEVGCMYRAMLFAQTWDERTFWVAMAIFVEVFCIAWRQILTGQTILPKVRVALEKDEQ